MVSNNPKQHVRSLIDIAIAELNSITELNDLVFRMKDLYSSAQWQVKRLAPSPVATTLDDLPNDFISTYLNASIIASDEVNKLRETTTNLLQTYFIIEESTYLPVIYDIRHDKIDCRGSSVEDITKKKLKVICDSYETARQTLLLEMTECERLVDIVMAGVAPIDDEVLFSARGNLVRASKRALLSNQGTFFYGLLNSSTGWHTDAIEAHSIEDDPVMLKLVITSIVDRPSFFCELNELDPSSRAHLLSRLDYYQINMHMHRPMRAGTSLSAVVDRCCGSIDIIGNNKSWEGLVWDPTIRRYSVKINASSSMNIMIGFAPAKLFNVSAFNYSSQGWYFSLANGHLFSQNGVRAYACLGRVVAGDCITCTYNDVSKEIIYEKNGVSLGLAYSNVEGDEIAPAIEMLSTTTANAVTLSCW